MPPTFLSSPRNFWDPYTKAFIKDVGFDYARSLHAEEEYIFHGPLPRVGDVLQARSYVADVWEKKGQRAGDLRFAKLITEFRDAAGELVAEIATTMVETSTPPEPS